MNTRKNSIYVSAPVGFTYSYASSSSPSPLPISTNIADTPHVLPNMGNPNMGLRMFNIGNMEPPMLNIANAVSYGGAMLPNMETPMFNIGNGVSYGGVMLPDMESPCNGVMVRNMNTPPTFDIANGGGVPLGNMGTNGVPYGGMTLLNLKTPVLNMADSGSYGARPNVVNVNSNTRHGVKRGRPLGSKNRPRGENSSLSSVILTVPAGTNLVDWVVGLAKAKKAHVTVQGGSAVVSEAHLSFAGHEAPPKIYKEQMTLLIFSGAHMYSTSKNRSATYFNAALSREDGVVVGGAASKIITGSEVVLSAYLFKNPELLTVRTEFE